MSERLSAVGGRFSLGSGGNGQGFRLIAAVPGSPARAAPAGRASTATPGSLGAIVPS
jgi:hypothetical protein